MADTIHCTNADCPENGIPKSVEGPLVDALRDGAEIRCGSCNEPIEATTQLRGT